MAIEDRLTKAKERLAAYYEAEMKVLSGQSYKMGTKSLTRADLREIRAAIKELENHVEQLESAVAGKGQKRAIRITPRDL